MSRRPLLPPRGIFCGTRLIFDPSLAPSMKETLIQLMALSWGSERHITPALSYPQLESLTGKDARTLRGHLSALRSYHAALRLQRAEPGQFFVFLADWLFRADVPFPEPLDASSADVSGAGNLSPQPDQENHKPEQEEEESSEFLPPLPDSAAPQPQAAQPAEAELPKALEKQLVSAGVFPSLLGEVAERARSGGYTRRDVEHLLAWCADEQPERTASLFIGRLRAGARAPRLYDAPVCGVCGQRGKHTPECRLRYRIDG